MIWNYVLIVIFICFSAFFSGTEIAYTSVNRVRLKKMAESGSKVAALAVKLSDKFEKSLTAILVGNNFVNLGAATISSSIAMSFLILVTVSSSEKAHKHLCSLPLPPLLQFLSLFSEK